MIIINKKILEPLFQKNYKLITFITILILSLCNFLLIHKYNIFVGDDGILSTIFSGNFYENKEFSIICKEIDFHKLYHIVIGYSYLLYFNFITTIINFFNLEFRWINLGSFILFFLSVIFFLNTFNSNKKLCLIIIMLTLEPFLVLSHSIRHDVIIFFGNAIILYCISKQYFKKKIYFEIFGVLLLTTHPSGAPLILAYLVYLFFYNKINKIFFLIFCAISFVLMSAILKGVFTFDTFNFLISKSTNNLISIQSLFYNLFDYFYYSKFKRHLIELVLFFIYISSIYNFRNFSKKLKILFFFPFIYFFAYVLILGYFNVSYLKFFYYFFLVYFSLYFLEIKNIFNQTILYLSSFAFSIVFFGLFVVFINHNPWTYAEKNISKISKNIHTEDLIAAPLYYSFLNPKTNNNFLPITQIDLPGKDECFQKYQKQNNKLDYVIADTRILNDNYYGEKINNYLINYELIEEIYIGRLGTQNLDKNGYLYLYKLR